MVFEEGHFYWNWKEVFNKGLGKEKSNSLLRTYEWRWILEEGKEKRLLLLLLSSITETEIISYEKFSVIYNRGLEEGSW